MYPSYSRHPGINHVAKSHPRAKHLGDDALPPVIVNWVNAMHAQGRQAVRMPYGVAEGALASRNNTAPITYMLAPTAVLFADSTIRDQERLQRFLGTLVEGRDVLLDASGNVIKAVAQPLLLGIGQVAGIALVGYLLLRHLSSSSPPKRLKP